MNILKTTFSFILLSLFGLMPAMAQKDIKDRFFFSLQSSIYTDLIWGPLYLENAPTGNTIIVDGQEVPQYANVPFQNFMYNIYSFGVESRYNLKEIDENTALAIAIPMTFGLGSTQPANSSVSYTKGGAGSFQMPIMLRYYAGSASTYKCEKEYGVSLGVGYEFNKMGLINFESVAKTDVERKVNSGFWIPVFSLGVHFWRRSSPMEVNLKYGQTDGQKYYTDRYGNQILNSNGQYSYGFGRAKSIRLSFVYLLGY
ncbi:MAG: hypothetical protein H6607_05625 [Flavobacteriales bacterium]|nr:hypothetical protein [Flavobacteriales bacterium]